jgi:hypothetical protein
LNKSIIEKIAIGFGGAIIITAAWFWSVQVMSVIELLEMAYG